MYDLHIHSTYSDGRFSPSEIIAAAQKKGLRGLAFCDHDNLRGCRAALELAEAARLDLIPAIELTTRLPGAGLPLEDLDVDLLGYGFNLEDPEFNAFTAAALNDLHTRMAACCDGLTAQGYPLAISDVLVENPQYPGTLQLLHTLQRKGYASSWNEALELINGVWLAGRRTPFTIRAAIEQIHLAGGVAVLAHPTIVRPQGERLTARWLAELVEAGLDGIEIYHRRLSEDARVYFLGLAREFDLVISGGSDLHGWHGGIDELGSEVVSAEKVAALRERSSRYRSGNGR